MKFVKFITAALGATFVVATFLPYWGQQTLWRFNASQRWESYLVLVSGFVVLGASVRALRQGRLRRVVAVAIGFGSLAVAVLAGPNFVPISPGGAALGNALHGLARDGRVGAKLMFFGGWAGVLLGVLGVVRPERPTV